jgi:hypothetical protein
MGTYKRYTAELIFGNPCYTNNPNNGKCTFDIPNNTNNGKWILLNANNGKRILGFINCAYDPSKPTITLLTLLNLQLPY